MAEMRREHPRWGARRIRLEMLRQPGPWARQGLVVPSERTIGRILHRQGLLRARPRKRPRDSYVRFERPGPMQLWQMDIVGGVRLVSPVTGELREGKVVTAVDDHSRYCVIAKVAERATARVVCLALAEALARFGVPEEIITDNGKQFTDRFGKHGARNGEVLSGKICRHNGITHRLTAPSSPNQNGKVERFHGTFRPDFLASPARSPQCPRLRPRWMPGSGITTPTGRTRRWMRRCRSPRPSDSPRRPPGNGIWSAYGSRRPWTASPLPGPLSPRIQAWRPPPPPARPAQWNGGAGRVRPGRPPVGGTCG